MSIQSFIRVAAMATIAGLATTSALAQITIPTVPIGNPGNAADPSDGDQSTGGVQNFGAVAYEYRIGTTEVTNAQYSVFLNAVAATDTHGLYDTSMAGTLGGITRSGSAGSYTYATVSGRENNPVNYVSFWDACRFANWLHNGQPMGAQGSTTTETGAYTLNGVTNPANTSVSRSAGWQWALPSENEWYKAAYHQPATQGGDTDNYWLYARSSNTITAAAANYDNVIGNTLPVGSYAANFYGTFDMTGNVAEWNQAIATTDRGIRGGAYLAAVASQAATSRFGALPTFFGPNIGFRVVTLPPPPCDSIDFNGDTLIPDDADLLDFLSVLSGGACSTGTCNDIDFNNDGLFPDDADLLAFLRVLAGGNC